jgi:hypothetical protein
LNGKVRRGEPGANQAALVARCVPSAAPTIGAFEATHMAKVTLRPTIPADLADVVGEPLPCRIRAITALVGDRVIGIGGIAFPPQGPVIAFVQLAPVPPSRDNITEHRDVTTESMPEAKRHPVAFHRAGLMAMAMIRTSGIPRVVATADAGSDTAVRWLKRLGFGQATAQPIDGKLVFIWDRESDATKCSRSAAHTQPAPATLPLTSTP